MLNDPRSPEDVGNGFTFRHGYTVVWSGWQPEAPAANNGMRIRVPVAAEDGHPIVKRIRNEIVVGTRGPEGTTRIALPYPAAGTQTARLTVRAAEADTPAEVPADGWRWIDRQTIQLTPGGLPPAPRRLYDLTYDATDPTVDGIGFAAVRDVVAHLRRQDGTRHVLGFGVSLSGRFLRHFLDLGMNRDEDGGRVFDGVLPHIAGAGKVFANEPFAMPGRTATQHEDRFYPEVWAPLGYGPGGLLRDPATDPKVIESNTSTEYWQKGASLVQGDEPEGVRLMMVAGTQHGGHAGTATSPGFCANPRNPNSAGPALRAMLTNLEAWVVRAVPPPPSLVPRLADETGAPASAIRMPAIPGVVWARATTRSAPPSTGQPHPAPRFTPCPASSPPSTPTATRSPESGSRTSRSLSAPPPASASTATCRASSATATASTSPSPAPAPNANARAIQGPRWRSGMPGARTTSPKSSQQPTPWSAAGCSCPRTPSATWQRPALLRASEPAYPSKGSRIRIVSSRSGLVLSKVTGVSTSSSIRRTYLIACAGSSAQDRAPRVDCPTTPPPSHTPAPPPPAPPDPAGRCAIPLRPRSHTPPRSSAPACPSSTSIFVIASPCTPPTLHRLPHQRRIEPPAPPRPPRHRAELVPPRAQQLPDLVRQLRREGARSPPGSCTPSRSPARTPPPPAPSPEPAAAVAAIVLLLVTNGYVP